MDENNLWFCRTVLVESMADHGSLAPIIIVRRRSLTDRTGRRAMSPPHWKEGFAGKLNRLLHTSPDIGNRNSITCNYITENEIGCMEGSVTDITVRIGRYFLGGEMRTDKWLSTRIVSIIIICEFQVQRSHSDYFI